MGQQLSSLRLFTLVAIFLATPMAALTGCGQMGGLYHPTAEDAAAPAENASQEADEESITESTEAR